LRARRGSYHPWRTQSMEGNTTMDRQELIGRLLALPEEIAAAERELLTVENDRQSLCAELQRQEDALHLSGRIDGKNAEIRGAQLREHTWELQDALANIDREIAGRKLEVRRLNQELLSLRAVAQLLGRGEQ
jgi:chromosome segregation ATPase